MDTKSESLGSLGKRSLGRRDGNIRRGRIKRTGKGELNLTKQDRLQLYNLDDPLSRLMECIVLFQARL